MKEVATMTFMVRRFLRREQGGALAELAIMVPFLAVMLAGVSEFGRFFQSYTTMAKATRTASRYLSNHPFNDANKAIAKNLAVCGKLACAGGDELLTGLTVNNICIESTGSPNPITVSVRIPETADGCADPYTYQPIFNLGGLVGSPALTLQLPISPGSSMYYMLDD